ncbi:hypothetical protein [Pseudonocardia sp. WMMC193]|uniref:hypothetical protein n=1 Tax=Pseudonocardia sp. WMMC193 TaxID=2911965 RepID=UPI001F2A9D69|nr:hypothetical protein [Pseudonocardia sp. WMMC193]MCF7552363.1 hypothetical protein [Pseudonocardia sp. WMMC193]
MDDRTQDGPSGRVDSIRPGRHRDNRVRVGLLADPGAPSDLAAALVPELSEVLAVEIDDTTAWVVDTETREVPLDEHGLVPLESLAREHRERRDWDVVVVVTDLPRRIGTRPVATVLNERAGTGLVSLPGLGALAVRRRGRQAVVHLVRALTGHDHHADGGRPSDVPRLSPLRHVGADEHTDAHLALVGLRGRLRLLAGMVRDNRPWRLVPHLSSATAAAAATGAYAIITTSFWMMASSLSPLRLLLISVVAIAAMATWLITYNHLWDRPPDEDGRAKAVLYNAATVITLVIGVTCMYLLLYLAGLLAALALIDPGYFSSQLQRPATFGAYLKLVWLASSVGIVAGALGSSLESEEAVRNATYGRREIERRRRGREENSS